MQFFATTQKAVDHRSSNLADTKLIGPDESREVEPLPLSIANIRHRYGVICTSQYTHLGTRHVVQSGSDNSRNNVGVYGFGFLARTLITVSNCMSTCWLECMHGRMDDNLRWSNENVSPLALLCNCRRETIFRASYLIMVFCSESARRLTLRNVVDCPSRPFLAYLGSRDILTASTGDAKTSEGWWFKVRGQVCCKRKNVLNFPDHPATSSSTKAAR